MQTIDLRCKIHSFITLNKKYYISKIDLINYKIQIVKQNNKK